MLINNTYSFNTKAQNKRVCSFGQIQPIHLFINAPKYEKNHSWASNAIKIIEIAKEKISNKESFLSLINFVSKEYGDFYKNSPSSFSRLSHDEDRSFFGSLRIKKDVTSTYISQKNRYSPYLKKFVSFVEKNGRLGETEIGSVKHKIKYHQTTLSTSLVLPNKKLNLIIFAKDKLTASEKAGAGNYLLKIEPPHPRNIKPVFKKINRIYNKIIENKEKLTSQNIKAITMDIANIHWLISQASPYCRGSAGIADVFCKALFESKGIQVSPYRANIDPNLEAFIQTLDEYKNNYKSFFSKPLYPIV